jgi:hypothetical protein
MWGPVEKTRLAVKACSLWCIVFGIGLFFFRFPLSDNTIHFYLFMMVTINQVIIACLLLFFYLPSYQSTIKNDAKVKSMHQVIQWWRGLSTFNVLCFTVVVAQVFGKKDVSMIQAATYGFLYTVVLLPWVLSFVENYSVVPTMVLFSHSPLSFPMALPSPTVTPIRVV